MIRNRLDQYKAHFEFLCQEPFRVPYPKIHPAWGPTTFSKMDKDEHIACSRPMLRYWCSLYNNHIADTSTFRALT